MNNKLWLTSMVAIGLALPASAATFPTNGYMQKSTTYTGAAISTNMGVTSGTANADAYYDIGAGYYLPANSYEASPCTAGNYCSGIENIKSTSSAQGVSSCPGDAPNSAIGATVAGECYTTCVQSDVPHSSGALTGGVYKNGLNMCVPSACVTGYSKDNSDFNKLFLEYDYTGWAAISHSGTATQSEAAYATYTDGQNDSWVAVYEGELDSDGIHQVEHVLRGTSVCTSSDVGRVNMSVTGLSYSNDGKKCYCKSTNYDNKDVNALWVFSRSYDTNSACATGCASFCAQQLAYNDTTQSDSVYTQDMAEYITVMDKCVGNTYSVVYSYTCTAGTGPQSTSALYGASFVLATMGTCTKTGYTATGWSTTKESGSGTDTYGLGATISPWNYSSNKTFSVVWTPNTTAVSFDLNSGSNAKPANVTATYDAAMPALSTSANPSRTGYTFMGWYDNAAYSSGTQYYNTSRQSSRTWNKDVSTSTLYAGWKADTITVNYACGTDATGNAPAQTTATYDANFTPSANNASSPCVKTGYEFAGWNDGTTTHQPGVAFKWTKASTTTLTAVWTGKQITIKWYGVSDTGNTNGVFETTVTYGGDITTPTTPKMSTSGQTFRGWVFRQ